MQAYQSAPCPYCGATWNPPGAQVCANCRNQLPPPQPSYAPPGYAPQPGQPQPSGPGQGYPYGSPTAYPQEQAGYPQYSGTPQPYPGQPAGQGYPGQGGYPGQPGQYPGYPQGYGGYPGAPYGAPGYAGAPQPGSAPRASTTLQLFGRSFTIPVALPPILVHYQQQIAYVAVGFVALLIVALGVFPAIATSQISAANQSLTAVVAHQPGVDAGLSSFFSADPNSTDLNVLKAAEAKKATAINAALASVQADESALNGVDQRLGILSVVAIPSGPAIAAERTQIQAALSGLKQADAALTAGSNMARVLLPLYDLKIDYAKMSAALNRHDLAGAGAPYPDALQKLQQAQSAAQGAGVPTVLAQEVSGMGSLLDSTESLIQSIQNKDAAGVKKYSDAVQVGLKTIASLSLASDYELKTFGPNQKAYDAAVKALKS